YQELLERGWRRFGLTFFRPVCTGCAECRSLRIEVEEFRPNRSMRRTAEANFDLDLTLQPASFGRQHLALYERYHADMQERRGWVERESSPADYHHTFVEGRESWGHELLFRLDGELVCVALVDILPGAMSAVYSYYEPSLRRRGLGVQAVLSQVEIARRRKLPFLYLGYWIEGNASMRYKARYRPHQILEGRPELDEAAPWRPPPISSR
ncbi:MAG: arginyltransferase, partial [Acidobacteriota bacterium]